jgi:hypothetical protein
MSNRSAMPPPPPPPPMPSLSASSPYYAHVSSRRVCRRAGCEAQAAQEACAQDVASYCRGLLQQLSSCSRHPGIADGITILPSC